MKNKYPLFIFALFLISPTLALDWQPAKVIRTIDTEHVLLANGKVLRLIGFDGPDHLFPSFEERGTARRTFQLLKLIFETQTIKILKDQTDHIHNIYPRHVKLENGDNLTTLLLSRGLGTFRSQEPDTHFDSSYKKAETNAIENKYGRWGRSSFQENAEYKKRIAGVMTLKWKKKYGHLLAPISIGRVKSVERGNRFTLENGACVRLLGVATPSPVNTRHGHKCFGEQSRDYLAGLILGKKIEFTKDVSQLDNRYCLIRHVWLPLPAKQMGGPLHINKEMISNGFGKASFSVLDKKFKKAFFELQENVYKNPRGAWLNCTAETFAQKQKSQPSIDLNCPVKISKSGKIHLPSSGWYKRLTPVKCFQNIENARKAGFNEAN